MKALFYGFLLTTLYSLIYGGVIDDMTNRIEENYQKVTSAEFNADVLVILPAARLTNRMKVYVKGQNSRVEYLTSPYHTIIKNGTNSRTIMPESAGLKGLTFTPSTSPGEVGMPRDPFEGFLIELNEVKGSYALLNGIKKEGCLQCRNNPDLYRRIFLVDFMNGFVESTQDYNQSGGMIGSMDVFYTNIAGIFYPIMVSNTMYLAPVQQNGLIIMKFLDLKINQGVDDNLFK